MTSSVKRLLLQLESKEKKSPSDVLINIGMVKGALEAVRGTVLKLDIVLEGVDKHSAYNHLFKSDTVHTCLSWQS